MRWRSFTSRVSPLIVALYALSAISVGLAHRTASPLDELAAFTAPDGTPAVICTDDGQGQPAHHAGGGRDCDACRLTASPGLLPVDGPAPRAPTAVALAAVAAGASAGRALSIFRAASRGPPAALPLA